MSTTQLDTLTAAVTKLQGDVTALTSGVATEVASLNATITALQNANPTIDLSAVIASVQAIDQIVTAATPIVTQPGSAGGTENIVAVTPPSATAAG